MNDRNTTSSELLCFLGMWLTGTLILFLFSFQLWLLVFSRFLSLYYFAMQVDALRGVGVRQIACGSGHTVVLTTDGEGEIVVEILDLRWYSVGDW